MDQRDLLDLLRGRRSVRAYAARQVPEDMLLKLIEAARWAPSAANSQPWSFVLVRDAERIAAIGALSDYVIFNAHVRRAAAIIVICTDPRGNRYHLMDCAFAAQNILLQAHSMGLGACFVGAFDERGIKELLSVPDALHAAGLITLGWPAEEPSPPPRLTLNEILRLETYAGGRPPTRWRRATNAGMFSLAKRFARRRRLSRARNHAAAAAPQGEKERTHH